MFALLNQIRMPEILRRFWVYFTKFLWCGLLMYIILPCWCLYAILSLASYPACHSYTHFWNCICQSSGCHMLINRRSHWWCFYHHILEFFVKITMCKLNSLLWHNDIKSIYCNIQNCLGKHLYKLMAHVLTRSSAPALEPCPPTLINDWFKSLTEKREVWHLCICWFP